MSSASSIVTMTNEPGKVGRKVIRKAKKYSESGNSPRRKSLQMLQPVAGNQSKLVSSDGFIRLAKQPSSRTPKRKSTCDGKTQPKKFFRPEAFTIFEDKSSSSSSSTDKTPGEQDVVDMLTSEKPSEKYWEELAETRRVALEETLKENEQLHTENTKLKEANEKLKVMADQAEYLADVVITLMGKKSTASNSENEVDDDGASSKQNDEENDHSSDQSREGSDCSDEDDEVFDEKADDSHEDEV